MKRKIVSSSVNRLASALDRFDKAVEEYEVMTDKLRDSAESARDAGDREAMNQFADGAEYLAQALEDALQVYIKRYYTSKY